MSDWTPEDCERDRSADCVEVMLRREREKMRERCAARRMELLGNPDPGAWPNVRDGLSWKSACLRCTEAIRSLPLDE